MWGAVMWTLTWFLVMVLLAMLGVGTWRFIDQAQEYADRRSSLKELDADILTLIDRIEDMAADIPTSCGVNTGNMTQPMEYSDDEFQIFSFSDSSSGIVFDLLGPGSNVTLSVQNTSGVIAYLEQIQSQSVTFIDDEFAVFNAADNNKVVMLDLSSLTDTTIQTLSIQDASGIIAYLSDVPPVVTTFLDDEFAVLSVGDNSKVVMLDCSVISMSTTQTMTVQDASGTIAYLTDVANFTGIPFADDEFFVHADGDTNTRAMFDASVISTSTTVVMTIQDRSGVIAYLGEVLQVVEVFITESRQFPDIANEGVATLAELGKITLLEMSLCGGGGGSNGARPDDGINTGGGAGGGFQDFKILNADERFEYFDVSLGTGGTTTSVSSSTTVFGQSISDFYLELTGYGGGNGDVTTAIGGLVGGGGGGGGGPGFTNPDNSGGIPGNLGGLKGGDGVKGETSPTPSIPPQMGGYRLPWRSGGGGGSEFTSIGIAVPSQGGYDIREVSSRTSGSPSIFGRGGLSEFTLNIITETSAGYCAGGGPVSDPTFSPSGTESIFGGDGAALMRYYIN